MTHFIRKQRFKVKFNGSESEGFVLQKQLMDLYYSDVLPIIEKAFDQYVPDNQYLVFDRLSIDIGNFEPKSIGTEFAPAVVKALIKKIEGKTGREITGNTLNLNIESKDTPASFTKQEFLLRVFINFLKTGNLPWSYKIPAGKNLEELIGEVLVEDSKGNENQVFKDEFVGILLDGAVRKRLGLQFSVQFCKALLGWISPETTKIVLAVSKLTTDSSFTYEEAKKISEALQQTAFLAIAQGKTTNETELKNQTVNHLYEIAKSQGTNPDLFNKVSKAFGVEPKRLEKFQPSVLDGNLTESKSDREQKNIGEGSETEKNEVLPKIENHAANEKGICVSTLSDYENPLQAKEFLAEGDSNPRKGEIEDDIETRKEGIQAKLVSPKALGENTALTMPIGNKKAESINTTEYPVDEENIEKEGIFIENAGLVLLHPFLPTLFENLIITEGETLIHPDKALCLLHYLASGRTEMPEYDLVLPKILCQIPISVPVPSDVQLFDNERKEADTLLESVIKHWEALRNTSQDGLRGTFLLRSGKLTKKTDGDWLLQVETRSFDILLDHLPWGISMIKLPWMKQMLWVEWRL